MKGDLCCGRCAKPQAPPAKRRVARAGGASLAPSPRVAGTTLPWRVRTARRGQRGNVPWCGERAAGTWRVLLSARGPAGRVPRSPPAPHPRPGAAGARTPRGARLPPARAQRPPPPEPCAPAGAALPGEAELAVVAALADREHVGVGRAGGSRSPTWKGCGARGPALARAAEALQPAVAPRPSSRWPGWRGGEPAAAAPRALLLEQRHPSRGGGKAARRTRRPPLPRKGRRPPPGARAPPGGGDRPGGRAPRAGPSPAAPTRPTVGRCGRRCGRPELRPTGRLQAGGRKACASWRGGAGRSRVPVGRDGVAVRRLPSASWTGRMAHAGLIEVGGVEGQRCFSTFSWFVCPCRKP